MTPGEVIKTLAKAESEWDYPCDYPMEYDVAIDEAIKAVEKQIPKKPEIKDGYYICPVCGVYQETSEGNPPYCINCGQAIGWEAKEGE